MRFGNKILTNTRRYTTARGVQSVKAFSEYMENAEVGKKGMHLKLFYETCLSFSGGYVGEKIRQSFQFSTVTHC